MGERLTGKYCVNGGRFKQLESNKRGNDEENARFRQTPKINDSKGEKFGRLPSLKEEYFLTTTQKINREAVLISGP